MALTATNVPKSRNNLIKRPYLMTASEQVYGGGFVMLTSAGTAQAAATSAGNLGVVGVAVEDMLAGASGEYWIDVEEGEFLFAATSIAQTAVGAVMFAADDLTFDETDTGNLPSCGFCTGYVSSTLGWVCVGIGLNA